MWTGSLNRVPCMITVWLLRETRCLLYPKARKHWRWQKSAVQAGLEKCCGGENDTVKFGSESLTMMAALLFAFNYTHTYAHTHVMTPALQVCCLPECEITHTSESFSLCVSFIPPTKESGTFDNESVNEQRTFTILGSDPSGTELSPYWLNVFIFNVSIFYSCAIKWSKPREL